MIQTESRPKVRDLLPGYIDDENTGCFAMNGDLVIRPEWQRSFVYTDKQRDLVVDTVQHGMPLGIMYWMKNPNTGKYELMDGQQRTLSILQYCSGAYSINYRYFHNLSQTEKDQILDYELLVYICEGTDDERREWFQRINVAGATLTNQEILNSIYSGPGARMPRSISASPAVRPSRSLINTWQAALSARTTWRPPSSGSAPGTTLRLPTTWASTSMIQPRWSSGPTFDLSSTG